MHKSSVNISGALIAHDQTSKILEPRVGSLHNPTFLVSPQRPSILMRCLPIIGTRWEYGLNTFFGHFLARFVAIVSSISNQSFGISSRPTDSNCLQGRQHQFHFRGGRRVHVKSERSTLAINQYHKLRSLASFCFTHFGAPFFAEAKVPSIKHSSQRIWSFSSSCWRKVRQSFSKVPSRAHFCSRRCTVLGFPYRSGNSLHGDPVHRIHNIPSKQWRLSKEGRPPFRSFLRRGFFFLGKTASILSHCRSVNFFHANFSFPPMRLITRHGDYDTSTHFLIEEVLG